MGAGDETMRVVPIGGALCGWCQAKLGAHRVFAGVVPLCGVECRGRYNAQARTLALNVARERRILLAVTTERAILAAGDFAIAGNVNMSNLREDLARAHAAIVELRAELEVDRG